MVLKTVWFILQLTHLLIQKEKISDLFTSRLHPLYTVTNILQWNSLYEEVLLFAVLTAVYAIMYSPVCIGGFFKFTYAVKDNRGRKLLIVKEAENCCQLYCNGPRRSFTMIVTDNRGCEVITLIRPSCCNCGNVEVWKLFCWYIYNKMYYYKFGGFMK